MICYLRRLQIKAPLDIRKYLTRRGLFSRLTIPEKLKACEFEVALGRAVLDRALLDSFFDEESFKWFDPKDEDFELICFIAFLGPEEVYDKFLKVHKLHKEYKNNR